MSEANEPIEEWEQPDIDEGTCDSCGETRPLCRVTDPFVAEGIIDAPEGEPTEHYWCYPCFSQRAGDV